MINFYDKYGIYCEEIIKKRKEEKERKELGKLKELEKNQLMQEYLEYSKKVPYDLDKCLKREISYFLKVIFPQILAYNYQSKAEMWADSLENLDISDRANHFLGEIFSLFYQVKNEEQICLINLDANDHNKYVLPELNLNGELYERFMHYLTKFIKDNGFYSQDYASAFQLIAPNGNILQAYYMELAKFTDTEEDELEDLQIEQAEYLNSKSQEELIHDLEQFKSQNKEWLALKRLK